MHSIIEHNGESFISVFFPGKPGRSAPEGHPNFAEIVARLEADKTDESVLDLFDIEKSVIAKFETLSERVSVRNGKLYLDGVETSNALAEQVVRFLYEGVDDWKPLVRFYENLLSNPNEHSREQLYRWLDQHNFVIDPDGYLIGYKYVTDMGDGVYRSTMQGYGIVDGVEYEDDYLPYKVGCVATMPRDKVQHDPSKGCSFGLHVGTWNYAASGSRTVLRVKVHPRDVVSVPTDCSWAKLRCCRFEVVDAVKVELQEPLAYYGKPEADELPRLIPASEWNRSDSGTEAVAVFEVDADLSEGEDYSDMRHGPVDQYDPLDQYAPIQTLGAYMAVPRIDSVDYTVRHPHSDNTNAVFDEDKGCLDCGEYYCEGECQECEVCGYDVDECRCDLS